MLLVAVVSCRHGGGKKRSARFFAAAAARFVRSVAEEEGLPAPRFGYDRNQDGKIMLKEFADAVNDPQPLMLRRRKITHGSYIIQAARNFGINGFSLCVALYIFNRATKYFSSFLKCNYMNLILKYIIRNN